MLDRQALKCTRLLPALLIFGVLQPRIAFGTTIIAAQTDTEVVISADSRANIQLDGQSITHIDVCKIGLVGGILVADSGIDIIGRRFSVKNLAAMYLSGSGAPDERISDFHNKLITQLLRVLTATKRERPTFFKGLPDGLALGIVLAYWDSKGPVVENIRYDVKAEDEKVVRAGVSLRSRLTRCPGECKQTPGVPTFVAVGVLNAVRETILKHEPTSPAQLPALLQKMVDTEIQADPDKVGGPISTVILDRAGPHWYQDQHGVCPVELK